MAFIFPTSHLPESGRPYDDDEEEDNTMQPMPRAGGVRAFSHLPVRDNPAPSTAPLREDSPRRGIVPIPPRSATPTSAAPSRTRDQDDPPPPEQAHGRREDSPRRGIVPIPPRSATPTSPAPSRTRDQDDPPPPEADPEDDTAPQDHADDRPWYMPRITAQDLPPQDHNEDAHAPTLKPWENTTRSSGFDDAPPAASSTRSSGFPPSTQDLRDDFHAPTSDSPSREAPAQDHSTALPRGRIFEKRSAPESFLRQQLGRNASGPSSQQRLQGSHQVLAAQQQARGANPPTKGGAPAAQPQALAQAQRPAAAPAQAAPAAPHSPAGSGWVDQAGQHPYKIHEADENAEIVRTADASAPPPQKGAKFGEHARSVINAALENSPTARAVLNKARELSGKDVVIHSTTATNAQPYIGLDGTIHIYVNPNTLLPGTLAHETAHAIQNWYQQAAKRGAAPPTDQELDDAKLRGRQELHKIAPVTYIDPRSKPEDDTSDHEPRSKSTENEAMRIANIVNAEISAAKVKAKMEAFKKERPEEFETMLKDPKKMAESVAQSFWFEQKKLEAISHQTDMHVPMRESTLYGKEGGLKHVLEMLGYGVTESHIKNAAPIRHRYAPPTPPR